MSDPHWIIKKTAEGDGNDPDHIDPQQFRDQQSAKFLVRAPRERAVYLDQLAAAIGNESDSSSLKSRGELLDLYRELRQTHRQLLALKR